MKFINDLLNSDNPTSSKRFSGLITLLTTLSIAIIGTIKQSGLCPDYMFNGLLLFAAACFGITAFEKVFGKKSTDTPTDKPTDTQ